jgi:hypothetical protein
MNLSRPTEDAISKLDTKKIAKAYRRLSYTSKKTKNEMTRAIVNQILVFEKIVKSWCMAPVKKKKERNSRRFSSRSIGRIGDQQQHFEIYLISLQGINQGYTSSYSWLATK